MEKLLAQQIAFAYRNICNHLWNLEFYFSNGILNGLYGISCE